MKGQLPTGVRLTLVRKGRRAEFSYEEDFGNPTLIKRTMKMIEPLLPKGINIVILNKGRTFKIHGTTDYSFIAGFIANEFMVWSPVMEMKLRDILLSGIVARSQAVRAEQTLDSVTKSLNKIEKIQSPHRLKL